MYKKLEGVFIDKSFIMKPGTPESILLDPDGIEADEKGNIYAHKGQFIDKDGKVITLTANDTLEFSADPVGILTETVNLTEGKELGSVMRNGMIQAEYLYYPEGVTYDPKYAAVIESKLPQMIVNRSKITAGE